MEYIAHIKKEGVSFKTQSLSDHLKGTAELSEGFARLFNNSDWGYLLGLWHDLGKLSENFQDYIKVNSGYEEDDQKKSKTDHTSAGAIFAKEILPQYWPPLAYCIASHHAGLLNYLPEIGISGDLRNRLSKIEFYESIQHNIKENLKLTDNLSSPAGKSLTPEQMHLWIRMLFSCLVDADYLDTERFMNPESFELRGKYKPLLTLKSGFDTYMAELGKDAAPTNVNHIRNQILKQSIISGSNKPGFFSMTVPTGGGKTLSSMAWALEHAVKYNKNRIIIVIPYTSIITQTARIYKDIFGTGNVIEHHSNIDEDTISQKSKLATENWDAPVIVTTNVQFFESLFANKTSHCRKLHNIVNSIIILDEAQMLPPDFLNPILAILKDIVDNYGVSVLFSTATQPALTGTIGSGRYAFEGIPKHAVKEIVGDSSSISHDLKRVKVQLPENPNSFSEWADIAEELKKYEQALCIVNTRKDCRTLYNLMPEETIHLSRMMCSAHILDTISFIKAKLNEGSPIKVISTQLIEAGVDIDFPIVYRAMAGLDSIAQSAGRCNREGKLNYDGKLGYTKVFCPTGGTPPGLMRKGEDTMKELLFLYKEKDFLDPEIFHAYFTLYYSKVSDFDKPQIKNLLYKDALQMRFQFATAARNFRLIDDKGTQTIIVEYRDGADLIGLLKRKGPENWLMRKLQQYTVSVNTHDFEEIRKSGLIQQVHGCWIQEYEKLYNSKSGIMNNGEWLEEIHII